MLSNVIYKCICIWVQLIFSSKTLIKLKASTTPNIYIYIYLHFTFTFMTCSQKEAIVYHEWYYSLSWMILLKKRELLCILFSILQATLLCKPRRRQETTSAKNVRTLLQKEFFQNGTKNCYGIGIYQTRISNFIETITLFFNSILRQGLKLMPTNKNHPGPVFRMWARRQQSKRRNPAKFNVFNVHVWLFKNFLTPELYLQCRETARYQENLPPASLSMLG